MKKTLSFLAALALSTAAAFAQSNILVGDMNDDGQLSIGDVTALTDAVLDPQKQRTITMKCDPNVSEPAAIAGQWRAVSGTTLSLTAEGEAAYSLDSTVKGFEYYPFRGIIALLNEGGYATRYFQVVRLTPDYLVIGNADGSCSAYYPSDRFASGFVLSATSLSLKTGETQQLSVLATPEGSISPVFTWTSSDPAVATVTADGLVTAVKGGTCTITATAQDSSSVSVSCTVSVVQLVESITLSTTSLSLNLGDTQKITATVLPADANDLTFTWSSSNEDVAEVTRYGNVTANGYGTAVITATANDGSGVKAECTVTVAKPHEYVDLGLPSGTLWATCNVGANSPEEYGDYFAWGEVNPKSDYSDWSTYFDSVDGSSSNFEKYNTSSGKKELDLEDDAAYMNWGEEWSMPSFDQIKELFTYTTGKWTTENGVYGRKVTSKSNGNSIFLPAAGKYNGSVVWFDGDTGFYWTRSLYQSNAAFYLTFNENENITWDYDVRLRGFPVRPVRVSASDSSNDSPTNTENAATKSFTVNDVNFNMVLVEHGTFQMGSTSGAGDKQPIHSVTISQDYYIGETEVTQGLWYAVTGQKLTDITTANGLGTYGVGDDYPMYDISWNDCQEFITKLNQLTGQTFRMPTEAEWEYAAKGGNKSQGYTYSGSNNIEDVAWYEDNSGDTTHPVATKKPNELGIYDMSGNVWEWCSDWYSSSFYTSSAVTDPTGPTSGSDRVARGGSWAINAANCCGAHRFYIIPSAHNLNIGFRLCLSPSK